MGRNSREKNEILQQAAEDQDQGLDNPENDLEDFTQEADLKEFLEENKSENLVSRFVIYKKELKEKFGKRKQVWETEDEIIKKHDCGLMFGSGYYTTYLILPPLAKQKENRILKKSFILGEHYDIAHRQYLKDQGTGPDAAGPADSAGAIYANMIKEFYNPLIMKMLDQQKAPAESQDIKQILRDQVLLVGEVVKESAMSQIKTVKELSREIIVHNSAMSAADPALDPEQESEAGQWISLLKDMIKEHGPELIKAGTLKMKMYAAGLKNDPQFQTLASNKSLYTSVFNHLSKDPDFSPENPAGHELFKKALDKLSEMKLGFEIPIYNGKAPGPAAAAATAPAAAA